MSTELAVPMVITEICPSCNPTSYVETKAVFMNVVNEDELLYQCCDCDARIWVDKDWACIHKVKMAENVSQEEQPC